MLKNVGIATASVAIGVPVWGIALAIGGIFVVGAGIGNAVGGLGGAVACGTAPPAA